MDTIQPSPRIGPFSPTNATSGSDNKTINLDSINKVAQKIRPKFKWMNELEQKDTNHFLRQSYTP